jgi:CheY-like chemotaxis protein/HPt (histidine-containing phosphotransfer) domain-containing protein
MLLEAQLALAGYSVEVVTSGADAVRRSAEDRFDVILMDWRMPDVDGLTATRRIRARDRVTGRHVPIIALTASALPGDRERCLAAGMDGFLAKPVDTDGIADAITHVLTTSANVTPISRPVNAAGVRAPQLVDWSRFDHLGQEIGSDALTSIVDTFLAELPARLDAIRAAVHGSDESSLRRAAHDLRSPSGLLGADALWHHCRKIEEAGAPLDVAALDALDDLADRSADILRAARLTLQS